MLTPDIGHNVVDTVHTGGHISSGDTQLPQPSTFVGLEQYGLSSLDQLLDTEPFRHNRLEAEFGAPVDTDLTFDLFDDEVFAFRTGADGNATLPSIYSDTY
jgi:hypothetical protein